MYATSGSEIFSPCCTLNKVAALTYVGRLVKQVMLVMRSVLMLKQFIVMLWTPEMLPDVNISKRNSELVVWSHFWVIATVVGSFDPNVLDRVSFRRQRRNSAAKVVIALR